MKRFLSYSLMALAAIVCRAQTPSEEAPASSFAGTEVQFLRQGALAEVSIAIPTALLRSLPSNRAEMLQPVMVGADGRQLEALPAVAVYGRRRYAFYQRTAPKGMLAGPSGQNLRNNSLPADTLRLNYTLPLTEPLEGSHIELLTSAYGCCGPENRLFAAINGPALPPAPVAAPVEVFEIAETYVIPEGDASKTRSLQGRAFVDFPVNKTEIFPDYRSNPAELGRIRATIDSVRQDPDVTVRSIDLCGYASPEGSYTNNVRLAAGRTLSLKRYVEGLYDFPADIYTDRSVAEDWRGLIEYVASHPSLPQQAQVLDYLNKSASLEPDAREWGLKSRFKEAYAQLLRDCYPALRHCDYTIGYTVRSYSSPEEILQAMRSHPQNLSVGEFFAALKAYEHDTPTFQEILRALRVCYPEATAAITVK